MMLKGKNAVITGATRGIGRAIALAYAKNGANIVFAYHSNTEMANTLCKELEELGAGAVGIQCDVSDFTAAKQLTDACKEKFGSLDILVNNAGITADGLLMRMGEDAFDKVISTNLKGTFNCIRHASALMVRQKSGSIINITSIVGIAGNAGQANYAASKAGVIGLTKTAAKELGSRNINVNAIAPGFIDTDMTDVLNENIKASLMERISLKRLGQPEDVANLAVFLGSSNAAYITGQVIGIDGGLAL